MGNPQVKGYDLSKEGKMKKTVMILSFTLLALVMIPVISSADANGWYVGASYGRSTIDIGIIPKEPTNVGYKIYGGYRLGALAVEGGYLDFGDTSDDYLGLPLDMKLTGLDITGLLILPLGPLDIFAKAGVMQWDFELDSAGGSDRDDGSDSMWGVGAAIGVGPVRVRAEAEVFNVEAIDSVAFFTLGATLAF